MENCDHKWVTEIGGKKYCINCGISKTEVADNLKMQVVVDGKELASAAAGAALKALYEMNEELEKARQGCEKLRKEANEWKTRAVAAEVTANEMAEESGVMIEQLQKEVEYWKSLANIRGENVKELRDLLNAKHNCQAHSVIHWGPGVNNIKNVTCMECGAVLYDSKVGKYEIK